MFILVDILRPFIGIFPIIIMFLAISTAISSSQTCELNLPEFWRSANTAELPRVPPSPFLSISVQLLSANVFQIWSTQPGYEEFARRIKPIIEAVMNESIIKWMIIVFSDPLTVVAV